MENPFEIILNKLDRIETLILSKDCTFIAPIEKTKTSNVLNLKQLSDFIGFSVSSIYKKTSQRDIPHYKQGKKLYFNKEEIENWLLANKITSKKEIEAMANDFTLKKRQKFK